jgi:hypothetical protein
MGPKHGARVLKRQGLNHASVLECKENHHAGIPEWTGPNHRARVPEQKRPNHSMPVPEQMGPNCHARVLGWDGSNRCTQQKGPNRGASLFELKGCHSVVSVPERKGPNHSVKVLEWKGSNQNRKARVLEQKSCARALKWTGPNCYVSLLEPNHGVSVLKKPNRSARVLKRK